MARSIKESVEERDGGMAAWRVTALLDRFGAYHLTPEVRREITKKLRAHGLDVYPSLEQETVKRYYTVRLFLSNGTAPSPAANADARSSFSLFDCRPDGTLRRIELAQAAEAKGVLWLDVEAPTTDRDELQRALDRLCTPEEAEVLKERRDKPVNDLLHADFRPDIHVYGRNAALRTLSAYRASTEELDEYPVGDTTASKAGALLFQLVEFAVGERWLVTCRHPGEKYDGAALADERGAAEAVSCGPYPGDKLKEDVARRWERATSLHTRGLTAGDLGILMLHGLADSYLSARRNLDAWLDQWELSFYHQTAEAERLTLIAVRTLVGEFRDRLTFFDHPRNDDPVTAWFPGVSDVAEANHVRGVFSYSLAELEAVGSRVSSSLELVSAHQGDRLRSQLDRVTFLLLIPTLIAGIFGANTALPWGGEWEGFGLMFAAMVALSGGAWFLVHRSSR